MFDRRSIGFLVFALLVVVAQSVGTKLLALEDDGGGAAAPRMGEPFVYLLPPTETLREAPLVACETDVPAAGAGCLEARPGVDPAAGSGATAKAAPLPGRKPETVLAENTAAGLDSEPTGAIEGPVSLLPLHAFKDNGGDGYLVLGSYADRKNAELAIKDFHDWNPAIVPARIGGEERGRVVIGPFRPAVMRQVVARLGAEGIEGVWPMSARDLGIGEGSEGS